MHVVILNGQPAAFEYVCNQFEAQDANLSVIDLFEGAGGSDENCWVLPQGGDVAIKELLRAIVEKNGAIDGFLYLTPEESIDPDFDTQKTAFLFAKHLSRWYRQSDHPSRKAFVVVTQLDGQLGLSGEGNWRPESGGLNGLVKTLHQEWTQVFTRVVDFSAGFALETRGAQLMAEWTDVDCSIVEVGISEAGRFTVEFEELLIGEGGPV